MLIDGIEIEDVKPIPPIEGGDEKEVFTFFGLAAYSGQCLEQGLICFALAYHALDGTVLNEEKWDALFETLDTKTFGQLLKIVQKKTRIPESILTKLEKSLETRNWLTHHFFLFYSVHFRDQKGRVEMIEKLRDSIYLFHVTDRMLETIYMKVFKTFGIDEDRMEKMKAQIWDEYKEQHSA